MSKLTQAKAPLTPSAKPAPVGVLQRKCACGAHRISGAECGACKDERKARLQRSATSTANVNEVPSIVHHVLRTPGRPLDLTTRAFFEPRSGHDFSKVRVHTGKRAAESARSVNSIAYTVGQDIVYCETSCGTSDIADAWMHYIPALENRK